MSSLFEPIQLGAIRARNRILMAPLTRARADRSAVPTPIMAQYYRQRATAGLIISEATGISRQGLGWPHAPGLWNAVQVEAWKPITDAVHDAGGSIVAQLWHMGRLVHPDLGGGQPVSASATKAPGHAHTYEGQKDYVEARPLTREQIRRIVEDYARAARNAIAAGFDGVQIHAANGYLIDQFLRDGTNLREDEYGGDPENRIRLLVETSQAIADMIGADRTAARFSPNGVSQGVGDSDPPAVFVPAARALERIGIAFLELREQGRDTNFGRTEQPKVSPLIRAAGVRTPLILNQEYTRETALAAVASGAADGIAFGRPFISNPDLPARIRLNAPWAADDMATWYTQGAEGYVDYPPFEPERAAA